MAKFKINSEDVIDKSEEKVFVVNQNNSDSVIKTKDYSIFSPYPKGDLRLGLHTGAAREQLKNSIEAHGITSPIKVIESDTVFSDIQEKYTVLSGHNRLDIAKELGVEVPFIVLSDKSEDICDEIVAEEHILNRQVSDFKPSQMMKILTAIKKTSQSQKELLEHSTMGKSNTYRYLRLAELDTGLLYDYVDENKIPMRVAEKIATSVNKENQGILFDYLNENPMPKVPESTLNDLLTHSDEEWNTELLDKAFNKVTDEKVSIKFTGSELKDIVPQEDMKNLKEIILMTLREYYSK